MNEWHNCYNDSWQGVLTPEAFAHPAKFARGLIARIYEHMRRRGYLLPGDSVIDPFGGVGCGALDAMRLGLHWTGVELEPRLDIFGGATPRRKERKSFFRRLAEKNGGPRIDHEDVIIMRKPL